MVVASLIPFAIGMTVAATHWRIWFGRWISPPERSLHRKPAGGRQRGAVRRWLWVDFTSAQLHGSSTGRELGPWRGSRSGRTSDRLAIFRQSYLSDPEFRPLKAHGEFASPERKHVKPYVEVTLPTSSHCPLLHAQSIRRSARQSGRRSDSDPAYATTTPRGPPEVFANGAS